MGIAGRSCVKSKEFVFLQQIEKFNWRVSRGLYSSPMYYSEATDCNWTLVIESKTEEAKHGLYFGKYLPSRCDYIEVSLIRKDYKTEYQSVDVRLSIVDSFNIYSFYASKEINFAPSFNRETLLRIRKSDLSRGCCGLNKMRFMPNDILTIKCEITVYETTEENYSSENELEDVTKYVKEESIHWFLKLLGILILSFCVFYFGVSFVATFFVMIASVYALWYFGNPGGDRTCVKPEKSTEIQSEVGKNDDSQIVKDCTMTKIK